MRKLVARTIMMSLVSVVLLLVGVSTASADEGFVGDGGGGYGCVEGDAFCGVTAEGSVEYIPTPEEACAWAGGCDNEPNALTWCGVHIVAGTYIGGAVGAVGGPAGAAAGAAGGAALEAIDCVVP